MPTDRWQSDLERIQREIETACRNQPGPLRTAAEMIGDALWHLRHHEPTGQTARPRGLDLTLEAIPTEDDFS